MSAIVQCECGAKLRLPDSSRGRRLRCPRCERDISVPAGEESVRSTPAPQPQQGTMCPICQTEIEAGERAVRCSQCQQRHHRECWSEVGGCATYGCSKAPSADKTEEDVQQPLTAWGDTKECPACGERIQAIAMQCEYCDEQFRSVDPMTVRDLRRQAKTSDKVIGIQRNITITFVVSLLGCLAPLTLIYWLSVLRGQRSMFSKCGPMYAVLAWTSLILSSLFTALIVLFSVMSAL